MIKSKQQVSSQRKGIPKSDARLVSLIGRGLAANSSLDKDDVINEIQAIWHKEDKTIRKNLRINKSKQEELDSENRKYQNLVKDLDNMKKYTAFWPEFCRVPQSEKKNVESMKENVRRIESEIRPIQEMSKTNLFNDIIKANTSDDIKRIQLLDLTFRRSEELSYTLQRKVIEIEHSQYLSQHLDRQKYPSVTDLVDEYKLSKEENDVLKHEESSLSDDAISKRRHYSKCSNEVASNVAMLYQNDFQSNIMILNWIKQKNNKYFALKEKSFDDVVNDKLFNLSPTDFTDEFSSMPNEESIKKLTSKTVSSKVKLESLKALLNDLQKTCENTEKELSKTREIRHATKNHVQSHMDKLWELNDRLFDEIQKNQLYIEKSIVEQHQLFDKAYNIIQEHRESTLKWTIAYFKYIDLLKGHSYVEYIEKQNANSTLTLLLICLCFSRLRLFGLLSDPISNYIQPQIKSLIPEVESITSDFQLNLHKDHSVGIDLAQTQRSDNVSLMDLYVATTKKKGSRKGRHKAHHSDKGSVTAAANLQTVVEEMITKQTKPPPFSLSRLETFVLSSFCLEHAGFLLRFEIPLHEQIIKTLNAIVSSAHVRCAQAFQVFSDENFSKIHLIYDLASPYLVIPKTEATVQTDPPAVSDAESQTLDKKELREMTSSLKKKK